MTRPPARMPLVAGNWKMNLNHLEAIALVQKLAFALPEKYYDRVEVAVLPPFTDIRSVQTLIDGDRLKMVHGAQDLSPHDSGAYTGDVSGAMLAKLGCRYVLVGHSERREHHGDDDADDQQGDPARGEAAGPPARAGRLRHGGGGEVVLAPAHVGPAVDHRHAQDAAVVAEGDLGPARQRLVGDADRAGRI